MRITLGGTIRSARIRSGLSQVALASRIHISKGYLSDIESNRYSPGIATISRLADALNINSIHLLRLKENAKPEAVES